MEEQKKSLNQLYADALARGYRGNFAQFAEAHNRFLTERARGSKGDDFLNDTGPAAVQENRETLHEMPTQQPREVPMYQQPTAPQVKLPDIKTEDDDLIWGIKKTYFYGGLAVVVILALAALYFFVFRKKDGVAANGGAAGEQKTNEGAAQATAQAATNDTGAATAGAGSTAAASTTN